MKLARHPVSRGATHILMASKRNRWNPDENLYFSTSGSISYFSLRLLSRVQYSTSHTTDYPSMVEKKMDDQHCAKLG